MYEGIGNMLTAIFVVAFTAGVALCALLFWLAPIAWSFIKPWLHTITG